MRFLLYLFLWRWHHRRAKRFASAAGEAQRLAAGYRERAYADAYEHAERARMVRKDYP